MWLCTKHYLIFTLYPFSFIIFSFPPTGCPIASPLALPLNLPLSVFSLQLSLLFLSAFPLLFSPTHLTIFFCPTFQVLHLSPFPASLFSFSPISPLTERNQDLEGLAILWLPSNPQNGFKVWEGLSRPFQISLRIRFLKQQIFVLLFWSVLILKGLEKWVLDFSSKLRLLFFGPIVWIFWSII